MNLAEATKTKSTCAYKIVSLSGDVVLLARLRELGFIPGEPLVIAGVANVFGEPILVEIRGATVALRKSEAECVQL